MRIENKGLEIGRPAGTGEAPKADAQPAKAEPARADAFSRAVQTLLPHVVIGPVAVGGNGFDARRAASELFQISRPRLPFTSEAGRIQQMDELMARLSPEQVDQVRAAYIQQYGRDPEIDMRGYGLGSVFDLSPQTQEALASRFNAPRLYASAEQLAGLLAKSEAGQLTQEDRKAFFGDLAKVGYPYGREQLAGEVERLTGKKLDEVVSTLSTRMPPAQTPQPPQKSVGVVMSSVAAQWQEFADWAKPLMDAGYQLQVFTPDGKPVAFQHDSLLYSEKTSKMGFGAPPHLNVDGPVGDQMVGLLANTASAESFDPKNFAQVMVVGGLGTDRDLTYHPKVQDMVSRAFDAGLDLAAICHGPTVFASTQVDPDGDGTKEPIARGLKMVGLPNALESYAMASGRVADVFLHPPPINVRETLEKAGADVSVWTDLESIAHQDRTVVDTKAGRKIATGVGPLAAKNLAAESIRMLQERASR